MGKDGQGLGFTVFFDKPVAISFALLIAFEEKGGRFAEGPLEMGIADFFAVGLLGTCNESAVGYEVLDGWEAMDVFDLIEDDQPQDFADAGDGFEQGIGHRVVVVGHGDMISRSIFAMMGS